VESKHPPDPMQTFSKDAEKLGLQQEDDIELYSDFGCISVKAISAQRLDQGSVICFTGIPSGWNRLLTGD
jgi:nitrate reductase alpha subunit